MLKKFTSRLLLVIVTGFFLMPAAAKASTLFEGWFEIYLGAKKIGFLTERYEFTSDNKFKGVYYLKTNVDGVTGTESLKAFSKADLSPLSYAYTSKSGEDVKIVDATFKGEVMSLKILENKKERKETKKIKKGTFLSTFLLYLIMQDKSGGLKVSNNYNYNAIAEEEGVAYTGEAFVSAREKIKGRETFKILNKFKMGTKNEEKFFTWVSPKGEIVLTRSLEKNIDVRFSESQGEATKGFMVSQQDLKLLFGKVPGTGVPDSEVAGDSKEAKPVKEKGSKPTSDATTPIDNSNSVGTVTEEESDKLEIKKPGKARSAGPVKGANAPGGEGVEIKGVPPPKHQ